MTSMDAAPPPPPPFAGLPTTRGFLGKVSTVHDYNATSIGRDGNGKDVSHELVQVGDDGRIYRSNGCQAYESGTRAYDAMFRARQASLVSMGLTYRIELDGGAAYKRQFCKILGVEGVEAFVRAACGRRA